jgi:hypothetical protein
MLNNLKDLSFKVKKRVYKLRKALYGLKQAPRAWYSHIDNYFNESGFKRSKSKPTLYVKHQGNIDLLIVALYVDDLILTGSNVKMIEKFKKEEAATLLSWY